MQALFETARRTRGFMPDDEGEALFRAALRAGRAEVPGATPPTFVEIGAWCGKSTVYLGAAAEATGAVLLSIDHHRGSEENQPGWEYHEPDLVDPEAGRIDTLLHWRRTITGAGLEASVVGIVGDSPTVAARWDRPLAFCFIDGGHGEEPAWADFRGWAPHVAVGGWLAIHDVFPDPADGGRPPYELYCAALDSGGVRRRRRLRQPARPAPDDGPRRADRRARATSADRRQRSAATFVPCPRRSGVAPVDPARVSPAPKRRPQQPPMTDLTSHHRTGHRVGTAPPPLPRTVLRRPPGGSASTWPSAPLPLLAVVVGALERLWLLVHTPLFADTAVVGLMGRQVEHGHVFTFYWNQSYGGVEPYVVAAVNDIVPGPFGINLTSVVLSGLAAVVVGFIVTELCADRRVGLARRRHGLGLAVRNRVELHAGAAAFTSCRSCLGLLSDLDGHPRRTWSHRRPRRSLTLGLAAGLGVWASPEVIYFVLPAAIVLVGTVRRWFRVRRLVLLAAGAVVGALPWLYTNATSGFASLSTGAAQTQGSRPPIRHLRPSIPSHRVQLEVPLQRIVGRGFHTRQGPLRRASSPS